MKKYVVFFFMLFSETILAQSLPGIVAFTPEDIVNEKVTKVNQQNQMGAGPEATISLYQTSQATNGQNLASVSKIQQVGLDLYKEGEDLRTSVTKAQSDAGVSEPQGCADSSVLSVYQKNQCMAADTLQIMSVGALDVQTVFKDTATQAYQTMADVSDMPLDGSSGNSFFAANSNGVPTESNLLYSSNTSTINGLNSMFKSLDSKSEYKGMKYNTQKDYFYLDGKKYSSSVLYTKDSMLKAGIDSKLADFIYSMLSKKAQSAQNRVSSLLKKKNLYDGKNWSIFKMANAPTLSDATQNEGSVGSALSSSYGYPQMQGQVGTPGETHLSSSLVEEKTLYKNVNGVPVGLSSDDIFRIVSRKYREKDRMGFFHSSQKK